MTRSSTLQHANLAIRVRWPGLAAAGSATLLAAALAGCASEGPLKPPTLDIPQPVQHLSAERFGAAVRLHWTVPERTTDGNLLAGKKSGARPLHAEVCRYTAQGGCRRVASLPVAAGQQVDWTDTLSPELVTGALRPLTYRVSLFNAHARSAAPRETLAASGEAPAPMQNLSAESAPGGVALHWTSVPTASRDTIRIRVVRSLAAGPQSAKGASAAALLQVSPGSAPGAMDTAAPAGSRELYTVYRSRTVAWRGTKLTVNGEAATASVAQVQDAFPPPPPVGLTAVANTADAHAAEVDLVWNPVDAPGLTGYLVYRQEDGGTFQRLTPAPVTGFTFADRAVAPGHRYTYAVSAVGRGSAEGARSSTTSVSLR